MDFVDDHQLRMVDETVGVPDCGSAGQSGVEIAPLGRAALGDKADEGALPALAGAVDKH
nr:hypothetical protein [Nocardia aurea]